MNKFATGFLIFALAAGTAFAKDAFKLQIEGKQVEFKHAAHVKFKHEDCAACHPRVPQSEEAGKVDWMFCRSCHDQSLLPGGIKSKPVRKQVTN